MPRRPPKHDTRLEDTITALFWTIVFVVIYVIVILTRDEIVPWYKAGGIVLLIGFHARLVVWVVDWFIWFTVSRNHNQDP